MLKHSSLSQTGRLCVAGLALVLIGGTAAWAAEPAQVERPPAAEETAVIVYQPARASKPTETVMVDNRPELGSAEHNVLRAALDEELRALKVTYPNWIRVQQRMLDGPYITDATPLSAEDRAAFEASRVYYTKVNKLIRTPPPPPGTFRSRPASAP